MRISIVSIAMVVGVFSSGALFASQQGSCEIVVSGDVSLNNKTKTYTPPANAGYQEQADAKRVHVVADYWLSDVEMRAQLEVASRFSLGSDKSPAALKDAVDKKMQKDPRLYVLAIGCGDKDLTLEISPASGTKYANIPYKPGHYAIGERGKEKAGEFVPNFMIGSGNTGMPYRVNAPGTLDIEQFDGKGLSGKFTFTADSFDKAKKVKVTGVFKYTCDGGNCAH